MLVYVLSNTDKVLGVFSCILKAQEYYGSVSDLNVKLEEFTLDENHGEIMDIFLRRKKDIEFENKSANVSKFEPYHVFYPKYSSTETIYKCKTCNLEDCNVKNCK